MKIVSKANKIKKVNNDLDNVQRVVDFLIAHEYSICSVESGERITASIAQIAEEGHLWCT